MSSTAAAAPQPGGMHAEPPTERGKLGRAARFSLLCFDGLQEGLGFPSTDASIELFIILCYIFSTDYSSAAQVVDSGVAGAITNSTAAEITHEAVLLRFSVIYKMFSDVHVMIFIGFGFLMTFLHAYAWSSVGFNFLLSAMALQWSMLTVPFWHMVYEGHWSKIAFDTYSLINGDFAAGALMISFGAVLGKASSTQLLVMMFFEMIVYGLNETIITHRLTAIDMGGSMIIHAFGAYFGLAVSWVLGNPAKGKATPAFTKWSSTVSMVGTVFLWIYWPSFNAALANIDSQQMRVVINTVLSIAGSCVSAFYTSRLVRPGKKFDFEDLQNATLAGGVAVGSSSDLVIRPWGALVIGNVAGIISTLGFTYLSPIVDKYLGIHDTCGVHNLHGMPGLLGGIAGAISAATAGETSYGTAIGLIFPARHPVDPEFPFAKGWSASTQGSYQFAALLTSVAFGIGGGLITGAIMRLPVFDPIPEGAWYQDISEWSMHLDDKLNGRAEHDLEHGSTEGAALVYASHKDVELLQGNKDATANPIAPAPAAISGPELERIVAAEVRKVLAAQAAAAAPKASPAAVAPAPADPVASPAAVATASPAAVVVAAAPANA